jgi:hypothetical protein
MNETDLIAVFAVCAVVFSGLGLVYLGFKADRND